MDQCSLNDNSYLQIIPSICIVHCHTILLNLFRFAFSLNTKPLHDFFKAINTICQLLDGNFDDHFNYTCTINFTAKLPLQYQIKLKILKDQSETCLKLFQVVDINITNYSANERRKLLILNFFLNRNCVASLHYYIDIQNFIFFLVNKINCS